MAMKHFIVPKASHHVFLKYLKTQTHHPPQKKKFLRTELRIPHKQKLRIRHQYKNIKVVVAPSKWRFVTISISRFFKPFQALNKLQDFLQKQRTNHSKHFQAPEVNSMTGPNNQTYNISPTISLPSNLQTPYVSRF